MIRLFHLIDVIPEIKVDRDKFQYIALGHFDAMVTWKVENDNSIAPQIISDPYGYAIQKGKDIPEVRSAFITGMREKDDEEFWKQKELPFLFLSSIQLKFVKKVRLDVAANWLESEINKEERCKARVYTAFDDSDMLVCLSTGRYHLGYETIMKYQTMLREKYDSTVLTNGTTIPLFNRSVVVHSEERVNIQLRCRVVDQYKFSAFKERIRRQCKGKISTYGVFGNEDMMIQINGLSVEKWVAMYTGEKAIIRIDEMLKYGIADFYTEILENEQPNPTVHIR